MNTTNFARRRATASEGVCVCVCKTRPVYLPRGTYLSGQKNIVIWQKRPIHVAKETHLCVFFLSKKETTNFSRRHIIASESVCVCVCVCICVYVCVYMCACICVCVYVPVYICVCMYVSAWIADTYVYMYVHTRTRTHTHTHTHEHIHTKHILQHTYIGR